MTVLATQILQPDAAPPGAWAVCGLAELEARLADGGWHLVEFWAPDCLFSRLLAPIRRHRPLADRLDLLCCVVAGCNVDCSAFGAVALPALVLFQGTRRVRRWLGAVDLSLLLRGIDVALADASP